MPTTRSQKPTSEPLQHYVQPRRASRKPQSASTQAFEDMIPPCYARSGSQTVTFSVAHAVPQNTTPSHVNAATQTDINLTSFPDLAVVQTPIKSSSTPMPEPSNKRPRASEEDAANEPAAKRRQATLLTPQRPKNALWMFDSPNDDKRPNTAPAKARSARSQMRHHRPRGPLTPRHALSGNARKPVPDFRADLQRSLFDNENLRPTWKSTGTHRSEEEQAEHDEEQMDSEAAQPHNSTAVSASEQTPTQTRRRGLFGGLLNLGSGALHYAMALTPLRGTAQRQSASPPTVDVPSEESPDVNTDTQTEGQSPTREVRQPATPDRTTSPEQERRSPGLSPTSASRQRGPVYDMIRKKHERNAMIEERKRRKQDSDAVEATSPGVADHAAAPLTTPASNKRKLTSIDGMLPGPRSGGFGIDDSYLDIDNDVEGIGESGVESHAAVTPVAKKQKLAPQTPRSALKKSLLFGDTVGRSGKSVNFNANPVTGTKDLTPHYGRAGNYRGSTFADGPPPVADDLTFSTLDHHDVLSPQTVMNTRANEGETHRLDQTIRDPTAPDWRPSPGNPRPGQFCLPDDDEDESMLDESTTATSGPPTTPRMAHAELPPHNPSPSPFDVTFNSDSITFESSELALSKARSDAQKYKPKDSSRLSFVEGVRSRSSSPPGSSADTTETRRNHFAASVTDPTESDRSPTKGFFTSAPAVQAPQHSADPYVPDDIDNTIVGADGLTAYQREHEYDDWAASLDWPKPQTYEEAGTGSSYITNLVNEKWTDADSRRSEEFWHKEFTEMGALMEQAKAQGSRLELVTGSDDDEEM